MNNLKELENKIKSLCMSHDSMCSDLHEVQSFIGSLKEERLKTVKPKIDFRMIPVDTLVEVESKQVGGGIKVLKKYFSHLSADGYRCFLDGHTSALTNIAPPYHRIRLLENEPKAWFGGECPLPDGVEVTVWRKASIGAPDYYEEFRGKTPIVNLDFSWEHSRNTSIRGIVAYQIHESEWQN